MDAIHKMLVPTDPPLGPRAIVSTVDFTTARCKLATLSSAVSHALIVRNSLGYNLLSVNGSR
jgi:hypothetical protein